MINEKIDVNSSTALLSGLGTYTGAWTDVRKFSQLVVTCFSSTEGTLYIDQASDAISTLSTLQFTAKAGVDFSYTLSLSRSYFRVRFANSSASAQTSFSLESLANFSSNGSSQGASPASLIIDAAQAVLSTTVTTNALAAPMNGVSHQWNIPVTVVSGTNPTLDISIQESDDDGVNWYTIFDLPRITTTGIYRTPRILTSGTRFRYVQTLSGTNPLFTRVINRVAHSIEGQFQRQLIDRVVDLNTLSSVTSSLYCAGARNFQMIISIGTASLVPQIQLQGSDDGSNWYDISTPLVSVVSAIKHLTVNDITTSFVRGKISTAGITAIPGYLMLRAF